jgi:hypothetical protein
MYEPRSLSREQASHFAGLALKGICREYPNKLDHVVNHPADARGPKALHPAFYGCFDWHSSVHGHWMLVRLLRFFSGLPDEKEIRIKLNGNLTAANLLAEAEYLQAPNRQSFERTYGWAWLLKLAEELDGWKDADGRRWSRNLRPLTAAIVARFLDFLPKQNYPIRTGVHPNTAFGLAFALDYARKRRNRRLQNLIVERARTYFSLDADCPASWEPGGEDFFSPSLMEADLMRRILAPAEFHQWFHRFLPALRHGKPGSLLEPAAVPDRKDPKLVHLDGLNLSRAWCMLHVANALPKMDPTRPTLLAASRRHANAALDYVASGDYLGEHWLASFAIYLLSAPVKKAPGSKRNEMDLF